VAAWVEGRAEQVAVVGELTDSSKDLHYKCQLTDYDRAVDAWGFTVSLWS
jgi:hypothetical protein